MATEPNDKQGVVDNETAKSLLTAVGDLTGALKADREALKDRLKLIEEQLEKSGEQVSSHEKVFDKVDQLDATLQELRKNIRNQRTGTFVPGLEDEAEGKKFSVLRASMGALAGGDQESFERRGAGYEFEVIKATREAMQKSGQIESVDSAGGFMIPDQVLADVIAAIYTQSKLIALEPGGETRVNVIRGLAGNPVKVPKFEGGMVAYWVGEEDDYAESRSTGGHVTMTRKKLGLLTEVTEEQRRFAMAGFEALYRNDMVRAIAKKLDHTVLYGKGTENEPRGLTSMLETQVYNAATGVSYDGIPAARAGGTWDTGELNFDGLMNMQGVLEDADVEVEDSWAYVAAPAFWRRRKQQKVDNYASQTTNQAYLLGLPVLRDETLRSIIGDFASTTQARKAIAPGSSIAATSGSGTASCDVFGANWNDVVVGFWSGLEIEDDQGRGTKFARDVMRVKMRVFADVAHRQPKALVVCPNAQVSG
jgi:HK97 family phage major capsid protein